jgi:hypothetical protein
MKSPAFPKATADMTQQEALDAIAQVKAASAELDKINAEKIQRIRELHDRHKSRRRELAELDAVTAADPDKLTKIIVSTRPDRACVR